MRPIIIDDQNLLILTYRKYERKINVVAGFFILLLQKFMSMFIIKLLLLGELPSLRDSTVFFFLGLHFITFIAFHSKIGTDVMDTLRKSTVRKLFQETFKGYGKGLALIALVHKGINAEISMSYFIWVLIVRGSASALFKSSVLSLILGKPVKLKKPKANFIFNTIPSITLLLIEKLFFAFAPYEYACEVQAHLVHFFIVFMVISRCLRSMTRIL